jgi:hypothetical protein
MRRTAKPEGKPLLLVSADASGRFAVQPEALAVLKACSGPVAVAVVCGRARQGKSYVLNAVLRSAVEGSASAFAVAPTTKPCTKGIWMWGSPLQRRAADGSR